MCKDNPAVFTRQCKCKERGGAYPNYKQAYVEHKGAAVARMYFEKFVVLYGSQTGTATELAEKIARTLLKCGVRHVSLESFEAYDLHKLQRRGESALLILLVSTAGLGELPKSMHHIWLQLKSRSLPPDALAHLHFAPFGLGDNSYGDNFNRAIRLITTRLDQLGANRLGEIGFGDVQAAQGHDTSLNDWLPGLLEKCGLSEDVRKSLPPKVVMTVSNAVSTQKVGTVGLKSSHLATNSRMTNADHFQDVRLIEFKCSSADYAPGDVAVVTPENSEEAVQNAHAILKCLLSDLPALDQAVSLMPNRPDCNCAPSLMTLRDVLKRILDLNRPPPSYLFEFLQLRLKQGVDSMYQEKLLELVSDHDLYLEYVWRPKRTTMEVLSDFEHALELGLNDLFDLFPLVRPRQFSIASAPSDEHVTLCVANVRLKTTMSTTRFGLCSQYLCDMPAGYRLHMGFDKGTMSLPGDLGGGGRHCYFIFLAAGTGIAPIRSMIRHLFYTDPELLSRCWLIQGCRYVGKDALFFDEFQAYSEKCGMRYVVRGSRDQEKRIYIQDILKEHSDDIFRWLYLKNAAVYLSGNTRLPVEIRQALAEIGEAHSMDGHKWTREMERKKQLQHETW